MNDDELHDLYLKISEEISDLVAKRTEDLSPEDDEEIRDMLNEQFRFWRR